MRTRLLALVGAVVLLGALVGGATFALFTATATPTTSTFTAGTLKIDLKTDDGVLASSPEGAPLLTATDMAPGDTNTYYARVANTGSLPNRYTFTVQRTDNVGLTNIQAVGELADQLLLTVERENGASWASIGSMSINAWNSNGPSAYQPDLAAGANHRYKFTVALPLVATNDAQGGQAVIKLLINATQTTDAPCAPGNTFATACELTAPVSGEVGAGGLSHFYKVNLTAGQTIHLDLTPTEPDPDLYLYGVGMQWLGGSTGGGYWVDTVTYTATTSGYHYVQVYAWLYAGSASYQLSYSIS